MFPTHIPWNLTKLQKTSNYTQQAKNWWWWRWRKILTTWPPQKKNQLLLVSSTSRPNLLCFGFDLTQSQSSKTISRNGYGPNWNRTNFNWRDQETDMVLERKCTAHQQKLYTRCFKMRLGEKLKRGVWRRYGERQAWNRGREGKRFTFSCSPQSSCFISYPSSLFPLWESRI